MTQKFLKKNKKKVRESRGFQNLSKSLIFSVRRESCERGFSWPNIAVTFLELKFGEVEQQCGRPRVFGGQQIKVILLADLLSLYTPTSLCYTPNIHCNSLPFETIPS